MVGGMMAAAGEGEDRGWVVSERATRGAAVETCGRREVASCGYSNGYW